MDTNETVEIYNEVDDVVLMFESEVDADSYSLNDTPAAEKERPATNADLLVPTVSD